MAAAAVRGAHSAAAEVLENPLCPPPVRRAARPAPLPVTAENFSGRGDRLSRSDIARLVAAEVVEYPEPGMEWASGGEVAASPRCPRAIAWRLAEADDYEVRLTLAQRRHAGAGALCLLAASDWDVWDGLVDNPCLPPPILKPHMRSDDPFRRAFAAKGLLCPPEWLSKLCSDGEAMVRAAAAANPNCPPRDLLRLGDDEEPDVRSAAAANPNWPGAL